MWKITKIGAAISRGSWGGAPNWAPFEYERSGLMKGGEKASWQAEL